MEAKLHELIDKCRASAKRLGQAAQHTRNRGLKLVLMTFAHGRASFATQLENALVAAGGETVPAAAATADEPVQRGFADFAAAMTAQRQGRERLLLEQAVEGGKSLIRAYEETLENSPPPGMQAGLQEQLTSVRAAQAWLERAAHTDSSGRRKLFVRLFNRAAQGEAVVKELTEEGIAREAIYVTPIAAMDLGVGAEERRHPRREIWTATVLFGAGIGFVLAALTAIGHYIFFPQINGFVFSTWPWIALEHLTVGTLFGIVFGTVIGLVIGQDTVEDDSYLVDESLQNGEMLVAVFAGPGERERVERIVGLRHEFEVRPEV